MIEVLQDNLLDLLVTLRDRENQVESVLEFFGGEGNKGFLIAEIEKIERMIVTAFGGNENHYDHLYSTELMDDFAHGRITKYELVEYIRLTIKKNYTKEVGVIIKRN